MTSRGFSKSRRVALAGGAALVVGGVAAANAAAQQRVAAEEALEPDVFVFGDGPLSERRTEWLKAVADKLGVTAEKLDQAIQEVSKSDGFAPPFLFPLPVPPLIGRGEPGTFSIRIDSGFGAAAKALGISEEQLRKEAADKSLTALARAHNVDPKVVADALKAQRRTDLDTALASGKLPPQMAERLKADLDTEIDHLMELPGVAGGAIFRFERSVIRGAP
jgi:hypothetical protein